MSTIITPSEEQINIVVNDEKISINVESGDVIVNVTENIVEVSTVNGGYPLPTTVYSVFGRTGNIIAVDGDYDLGELGDVTLVSSTNGDVLTYDGTKWINKAVTGTGTVTSVNMTVPVGLQVSGNPITVAGTLAVNFASGYSLPTTAKQTTWDAAYNDSIVSASVSGTTTKTLTLNQQDGGTITASWTDIDTNLVTSVNGYVGTVVLTTTDIAEGTRLYYTETRVSNNVDVAANTAARHSAVTIGTANGLSLASQVLSLALASASTTGALSSTDWVKFNTAYNDSIVSASVSGTTTKTLTLTQQDAGTITASWSDLAASGTVTSVAASVPTGLTISGSPIVSAGTLAFGLDTGYTIPLSTQLMPTGGTTGQILTKNSATNYDTIWSDNYADWTEQIRDTVKAEVAINKGQAVYISGANGTNQLVSLASNTTEPLSSKTLGLAMQNLAINGIGAIITEGLLGGLNTSTATAGDPVWLGVSGNLIYGLANKPVAPAHLVYIGVVTRSNINNGEIYVKIQNGFELQELHNVLISSVANNEGLFYETATTLWKNKSIATVLGYTPISLTSLSGVSPLSYNNTTGAFSIAQATTSVNGYLSSTDWTTFNGKQAALSGTGFVKISGTTISYDNSSYYLASNPNAYIALTGLSATAPLSYNNTTGGFTISQAGVSGDGYLSSTDWNTFNNKQASGNYITALSGEATASGPGSAAVTLSTSAVTGKILTGVNITGGSITATDSILVAFGKVQNQINGVLGGAIYQSVWNASTNSPTLTSGTGTKGYYYIVSVAGSTNLDGITDWKVGDWAIFNGTTWNKVDNTDAVSSVNGYTGAVSLTTSDITEGSRLYYTEVRVSANTDVAANTAARHAAVTIGTANGLSLSTQALSLGLASTSTTGALSSTDWNTFNLKQAALSGTGFVKISGTTISYDNSTYLTTSAAASTYLPLAGGTLTGPLNGTSILMSGVGQFQGYALSGDFGANYTIGLGVGMPGSSPGKGLNFGWNNVDDVAFIGAVQNGTAWKSINIAPIGGAVGIGINPTYKLHVNGTLGVVDAATFSSSVTATSFVKTSGTSSQFLKADGSVDSTAYGTGSVTSVGLSSATSGVTIGSTPVTTSGTITIAISTATTSQNGLLSSTDWTIFNNKQNALTNPVTGTGSTNYVTKWTGTNSVGYGIIYDNGTTAMIGTTTTSIFNDKFKVVGGVGSNGLVRFENSSNQTDVNHGTIQIVNTAAYAVGNDASIGFSLSRDDSSYQDPRASIGAKTESSYGGALVFNTRSDVGTYSEKLRISGLGVIKILNLAGTGSRMVIADSTGILSTQAITTGTVTSVAALTLGTTGTDLSSTVATNTTTPVITLNVPTASASNRGALSSADWTTFNGKQAALNGTGFVKISGTTISYDNSTYLTTSSASSTYLPLAGGILTGRTTGIEIGVTRNGADTIGDGPWFRWTNANESRQMLTQLNASNGLSTWAYNGSAWVSIYTLFQSGAATFTGAINGTTSAFSGQVTSGSYTASGDFGSGYTISAAIGISGKGVNIGWNTTLDRGFIGTVHNGTAWKSLILCPIGGDVYIGATGTNNLFAGAATFSSSVIATAGTFSGQFIQGGGAARSTSGTTIAFTGTSQSIWTANSDCGDGGRFISIVNENTSTNAFSGISFRVNPSSGGSSGNAMLDTKFVNNGSGVSTLYWSFLTSGGFLDRMSLTNSGVLTAASFFESSDSRFKKLIQDNYQTKGIASITPKLYTKNGKVELGYYAQDLVGILDSAVSKGSDDMLSLSYREVLVAKVYALEQEIKELKGKMN
jgi:hypothetical protein